MIVKQTYIAEDGKEFEYERECAEYEAQIRAKEFKDTAMLFDSEGNPLPLTSTGFETCYFILCRTDEAARYMEEEFGNWVNPWCGRDASPIKAGCWIFYNEYWQDAKDLLKIADIAREIMGK